MRFISLSDEDKREMLKVVGVSSPDDLFASIPEKIRLKRALDLPEALAEPELIRRMEKLAGGCRGGHYLAFLGGGAYSHYIPEVVDYLSSRGEFLSPYTPYQPEVSQGTLQVIFEFQTLICQLTGMEIANASLYDGASGAAEALLMAQRINKRTRALIADSLHPQYRKVIETYTRNMNIELESVGFKDADGRMDLEELKGKIGGDTIAVICQSPNYFGVVEDFQAISNAAHEKGALSVAVITEALSLGLLKSPGEMGADIVTGEAQSFGIPLGFGGPHLGFMATAREFIRQFPGRIAGQTRDVEGKRGFVLTLSTREQHIRRERATSNICTNQAHCALRATIYLETLGREGLRELARLNLLKARYAAARLEELEGVSLRFSGPVFNEFTIRLDRPWSEVEKALREQGILGGLGFEGFARDWGDCALVCITERHSREDIDRLAASLKSALES